METLQDFQTSLQDGKYAAGAERKRGGRRSDRRRNIETAVLHNIVEYFLRRHRNFDDALTVNDEHRTIDFWVCCNAVLYVGVGKGSKTHRCPRVTDIPETFIE